MQKEIGEVRIIAFVTKEDESKKYPMPDDFLCDSELPNELLEDVRANGWTDENGNVWFSENYSPPPGKGADGNVYLLVGDTTEQEEVLFRALNAYELLDDAA